MRFAIAGSDANHSRHLRSSRLLALIFANARKPKDPVRKINMPFVIDHRKNFLDENAAPLRSQRPAGTGNRKFEKF